MQTQHLLRYDPRGSRVTVALLYGVADGNVYGWYVGAAGRGYHAAYFALTHLCSAPQPVFMRSIEDDLYGAWLQDAGGHALRVHSPLPDVLAVDIARLQWAFIAEWLVLDPDSAAPADLLLHAPVPRLLSSVSIRPAQVKRLERAGRVWQYATTGVDFSVAAHLAAHWHIDERCDVLPLAVGEPPRNDDAPAAADRAASGSTPQPLSNQR